MTSSIANTINAQREKLNAFLRHRLQGLAEQIRPCMHDREKLDACLQRLFRELEHCKYVYMLDSNAVQISSTVNRYGPDLEQVGRDRSTRPYMQHMSDESIEFNLSDAYISRNKKRPSITAIQTIFDDQHQCIGFLGVDYDLRELPHSEVVYEEPSMWRQIKGDPAIRGGLFTQQRVESKMDKQIDQILSVHKALMLDQGVHHFQIHFSGSRSTIWHIDDPYIYRILTMDELSNTDICLAYPKRTYFHRNIVPPTKIDAVLKQFKALRFADETIYLRSASFNLVNGKVGLNFSCDGTHYLNYEEFLKKGLDFWFGGESFPQPVDEPVVELDKAALDNVVDTLAEKGCIQVNKLLYAIENGELPDAIRSYSESERAYIFAELKAIMDVYEGGSCAF